MRSTDDMARFADVPIFAIEEPMPRTAHGLPASPAEMPTVTAQIGDQTVSGQLLADAEQKSPNACFAPGQQKHNKLVAIYDAWTWTGSWNLTLTGLHGSDENSPNGILGGSSHHAVELHAPMFAAAYRTEFEEMRSSSGATPDPAAGSFHSRTTDNTLHKFIVGGRKVEVFFSPGDDAIGRVTVYVRDHTNQSWYFTILAWSDQSLVDALKVKWEGLAQDGQGLPRVSMSGAS